jgi:hypothetical protein
LPEGESDGIIDRNITAENAEDAEMSIFEPNRIRYTLWFLLYYAVAWYVIYIGFQVLSGNKVDLAFFGRISLGLLIVALVGAFVIPATHPRFMKITALDEIIAGPSVWFNRPVRLNLSALNTEKSQRRSILQRVLGYRLIVSTSGEKILFIERAFDKDQVAEILKTIGCADSMTA